MCQKHLNACLRVIAKAKARGVDSDISSIEANSHL